MHELIFNMSQQFVLYEPYRLPLDYDGIMTFHRNHQVADLEWFEEGRMHRVIAANGKIGQLVIANDPEQSRLIIEVDFPDESVLKDVSNRVRNLFDLDANPAEIQKVISLDPGLDKLLKEHPGLQTTWL